MKVFRIIPQILRLSIKKKKMSLGCSHRLYAYAHGILFLRVLGSLVPVRTDPKGAV